MKAILIEELVLEQVEHLRYLLMLLSLFHQALAESSDGLVFAHELLLESNGVHFQALLRVIPLINASLEIHALILHL